MTSVEAVPNIPPINAAHKGIKDFHQSAKEGHYIEKVLNEYERALEVAHHADTVIYEVAAIVWSAETLLLGFILEAKCDSSTRWLITASAGIGLLMNFAVPFVHSLLKPGQNVAFGICQQIEDDLSLPHRLHHKMRDAYPIKKEWTKGLWILSAIFTLLWIYVIYHSMTCGASYNDNVNLLGPFPPSV